MRQSLNACVTTITYIRRTEVASQIIFLAQFYSHCGTIAWFSHVMLTITEGTKLICIHCLIVTECITLKSTKCLKD